jgi:hypothetical protein
MTITMNQFKSLDVYLENSDLYDSVFKGNKALINYQDGFIVYLYEFKDEIYDSHPEFHFYPNKMERIFKTITEIKKISFEDKLTEGLEQLTNATNLLLDTKEKKDYDLEVFESVIKEVTNSIFKTELTDKLAKLKLEITDLQRNLPKRLGPIITDSFLINSQSGSNKYSAFDLLELPVEMKKHKAMNGLVLPKKIHSSYAKIWTGFKPAPRVGQGTAELWEKVGTKWKCISEKMTWVS